jgi:hypothetical protein
VKAGELDALMEEIERRKRAARRWNWITALGVILTLALYYL